MDFFISFLSTHLGLFGTQEFTKKKQNLDRYHWRNVEKNMFQSKP
jgi:hypothetical protein